MPVVSPNALRFPGFGTRTKQARKTSRRMVCNRQAQSDLIPALIRDPTEILTRVGLKPDPWQRDVLCCSHDRIMMCASRQIGKTFTTASIVLREMLIRRDSLVLVLSPTLRQSKEFFRKALLPIWRKLGEPLKLKPAQTLEMELSNGSRLVALPDSEEGIRGFSAVRLLVIDEAARVSDELYHAVTPMLAVSRGRMIVLSSPWAQQGWFYEAWTGPEAWKRIMITAAQCPRFTAEFLAVERARKGKMVYAMEYEGAFGALAGSVFDPNDVDAAFVSGALTLELTG
jgi:hypothetical protein